MKNRLCRNRGLQFGGNANNGAQAGSFISNSNNAPSSTIAYHGSRLSLEEKVSASLGSCQKTTNARGGCIYAATQKSNKKTMEKQVSLFKQITNLDNLRLADEKARKGKRHTYGVQLHDRNKETNLKALKRRLENKEFKTSEYETFKIFQPKERTIYRLPYFPDRIVHHAIMNVLEPIWMDEFSKHTYGSIKGRGIHPCIERIKRELRSDNEGTKYCLKIDIRKFFPNVDNEIMKEIVRVSISDADVLDLLDELIDSSEGLPIGNYMSQFLANLYLTYFDHWVTKEKGVKYYHRYMDDVVVFSGSKEELWQLFREMKSYLRDNLKLEIKGNYQVFPIESRGVDFLGYVMYHTHTLLRKDIKKNFARAVKKNKKASIVSYLGWAKHCDSKHLLKKLNLCQN